MLKNVDKNYINGIILKICSSNNVFIDQVANFFYLRGKPLFFMVTGKDESNEIEMTIPGLDWGMEEVMQKDQKKVPQKKVPYAKPIPAQFQQVSKSDFTSSTQRGFGWLV